MSEQASDPHPPLEPDRLPAARIALCGVLVLAVIGVAIAVAAAWALGAEPRLRPQEPAPSSGEPVRISGVLQGPIAPDDRARPPPPLGAPPDRFAWVDREREWLRLPIEEAMAWVVEQEQAR